MEWQLGPRETLERTEAVQKGTSRTRESTENVIPGEKKSNI
jgi:hypothetical protein